MKSALDHRSQTPVKFGKFRELDMNSRIQILRSLMALLLPILLVAPLADAQDAQKMKSQDEEMRQSMVVISRQLGVVCTFCHITENFKSAEKLPFKVAKEHIKFTQLLIDHGMDGKSNRPKADCFMCHRGVSRPDYIEKVSPMQK
jgi:hypothetical protein